MASRRNGSVSRAAEAASKNRLHMDRNPQHPRLTDPANPAGRRKEIDNVMKRARQASPGSFDRRLLEAEEKDPNRWRHTGYKAMYLGGSKSPSPRRSRSPPPRPRSPPRRSRSPVSRRSPRRSPPPRRGSPRRSPRRSPLSRRSPLPRRSPALARKSPAAAAGRKSPASRRVPATSTATATSRRRPPSPPHPPNRDSSSGSGSSSGSCSDESCSVCSGSKRRPPPPPKPRPEGRVVQPTRELLKARESSKRTREEKVLEWQRALPPTTHIKREGERRERVERAERPERGERAERPDRNNASERGVSPGCIAAALTRRNASKDTGTDERKTMTLSERFGKMAQWSATRADSSVGKMQITRRAVDARLLVEIGSEEGGDAPNYPDRPLPAPDSLLPRWDDVTTRYDYYRSCGYLRGLTLQDYVKWEDWWYKYQDWLKRERQRQWHDEPPRRERRRRGGRHRRS